MMEGGISKKLYFQRLFEKCTYDKENTWIDQKTINIIFNIF